MQAELKQTAPALSKDSARRSSAGELTHRFQEPLVLRAGAIGDAQMPGAAERGAGTNGDSSPGERLDRLTLVQVAQVDPGEVRLRLGGLEPHRPQLALDQDPLDHVLLDAIRDVVLMADGLGR